MKNFKAFRVAVLALLMAMSFALTASAKDKAVERGMTKEQVVNVCGKPMATSFDEVGETWTYRKTRGGLLTSYYLFITVVFDGDGRVARYSEEISDENPSLKVPPTDLPANGAMRPSFGGRCDVPFSDSDFGILLSKVRNASFDDRKLDLIQVACLGGWLTCRQGASLVAIFPFTDGKMKALKFVAPRLVDLQNANEIYRLFTFSSDRDRAADIISKSRQI